MPAVIFLENAKDVARHSTFCRTGGKHQSASLADTKDLSLAAIVENPKEVGNN